MSRGGYRARAGRPVGTGKYGTQTKAVRVPVDLVDAVHNFVMAEIAKKELQENEYTGIDTEQEKESHGLSPELHIEQN